MGSLLLVRNDVQDALDLCRELRRFGHAVVVESEFRSALTAVEERDTDLLICDEVVPGGLGVDLVAASRTIVGKPLLPAILIFASPPLAHDGVNGMDNVSVIVSPFCGEHLVESVARFRIPLPGDERRHHDVAIPGYNRRTGDAPGVSRRREKNHR